MWVKTVGLKEYKRKGRSAQEKGASNKRVHVSQPSETRTAARIKSGSARNSTDASKKARKQQRPLQKEVKPNF